jgi:HD-like signal output (HDOD) protein
MSLCSEENTLTKEIVLSKIPAFPPVVLRVLDLLASEEADTALLAREISSDATLCAQVLRLANSPLFGLVRQIDTVQHALATLGLVRVQALLASVATTNYMRGALQTSALQKCWRHSVVTAVLSRELAQAANMPPDRAYSLGLLHDIGRLGLLVAYSQEYDRILTIADRDAVSLLDQEQKLFGIDHCEAGRILFEQWKLPDEFRLIVGRHHDPPDGGTVDSLLVAHWACQMADTLGYAVATPLNPRSFDDLLLMLPPPVRDRLHASQAGLVEVVERALGDDRPNENAEPYVEREATPAPAPRTKRRAGLAPSDLRLINERRKRSKLVDLALIAVAVLSSLGVLAGLYQLARR